MIYKYKNSFSRHNMKDKELEISSTNVKVDSAASPLGVPRLVRAAEESVGRTGLSESSDTVEWVIDCHRYSDFEELKENPSALVEDLKMFSQYIVEEYPCENPYIQCSVYRPAQRRNK